MENVTLHSGSVIDPSAEIHPGVRLGPNCLIGKNVQIGPFKGDCDISIGEKCVIHDKVRILVDKLAMGAGCTLHNHVSILAGVVVIGDNVWVGQRSHLDGTAGLTIADHVTIGYNCYLWTHSDRGGLPEGCNLVRYKPTYIGERCWLIGCNVVVNPGVWLAARSTVLSNAVVTHSTESNWVYGGVPARKLWEGAWRQ